MKRERERAGKKEKGQVKSIRDDEFEPIYSI